MLKPRQTKKSALNITNAEKKRRILKVKENRGDIEENWEI